MEATKKLFDIQTVQYLLLLLQQNVVSYSCWQYNTSPGCAVLPHPPRRSANVITHFQLTNDINEQKIYGKWDSHSNFDIGGSPKGEDLKLGLKHFRKATNGYCLNSVITLPRVRI